MWTKVTVLCAKPTMRVYPNHFPASSSLVASRLKATPTVVHASISIRTNQKSMTPPTAAGRPSSSSINPMLTIPSAMDSRSCSPVRSRSPCSIFMYCFVALKSSAPKESSQYETLVFFLATAGFSVMSWC